MNKKLMYILLAISLGFNVFFTVGFLHARKQIESGRTFRGRAERFAKMLQLETEQYKQFQELLAEAEQVREIRRPQREAFLNELIKEEPDEKVLEDFLLGESMQKHCRARLALMRKFAGLLRPEQRERFVEIIKKRTSPDK